MLDNMTIKLSSCDDTSQLKYAGSVLCMDPLNIGEAVKLSDDVIDTWHIDLLDGTPYYKRLGCYPEQAMAIRRISDKPMEVHAMVADIENYIDAFKDLGNVTMALHVEHNNQVLRNIEKIKKAGMEAAIVCNLQTTSDFINNILSFKLINMVEFMSINPGMVGTNVYLDNVKQKAFQIRYYMKEHNINNVDIGIDGGVRVNTVEDLYASGINYQVCGSILYSLKGNDNIVANAEKLKEFKTRING